jgi:4-amino-4-deoxy-L-arabinose transferase-like glycosyltransferase
VRRAALHLAGRTILHVTRLVSPTTSRTGFDGVAYRPATESQAVVRVTRLAVPALIALAVALRLTYYLLNPSLSNDEASLALNLIHRSYAGLFERLDFNQAAPPGFLLLQKLAIDVFGTSPYSIRLVPLLAGAAACLLVHRVTARIAGPLAAIIALTFFAVSDPLITYAATNKQYSIDVAVVLALYALAIELRQRLHARETVLFALVGMAAVFVSHPAVFVLASIWAVLSLQNAAARRWGEVARLAAVAAVWLGSFATAYLTTRTSLEQVQRSVPLGWERPAAALRTLGGTARYLLGIPTFAPEARGALACIAVILSLVGIGALSRRNLSLTIVLVAPAILAGVAVSIELYPNFARTFLFVIPSLMVLLAGGTGFLLSRRWGPIVRGAAGLAVVVLIGAAFFQTIRHLRSSKMTETTRVLAYLAEEARSGDTLYVSRTAQYTFRYYAECSCFANSRLMAKGRRLWPVRPTAGYGQFDAALKSSPPSMIAGKSTAFSRRDSFDEFSRLLGRKRVWILLVDPDPKAKRALTTFLGNHGRLLDAFPDDNEHAVTSLFLYALRPDRTGSQ